MQCLPAIGAPARYVNWVKEYITSLSFTNAINGSIVGFFKGGRGLRQSDPLSPYLFVQGMEVTSRIISDRVHTQIISDFTLTVMILKLLIYVLLMTNVVLWS